MKKKMDQLEESTLAEMRFDIRTVESSLFRVSNNSEENFKKTRERLDEEIRKVTNDIKSKFLKQLSVDYRVGIRSDHLQ